MQFFQFISRRDIESNKEDTFKVVWLSILS